MDQDLLLLLRTFLRDRTSFLFVVEAILCRRVSLDCHDLFVWPDLLQKLLRMRAALSASLSSVCGQKLSTPIL